MISAAARGWPADAVGPGGLVTARLTPPPDSDQLAGQLTIDDAVNDDVTKQAQV
ncbi:hypothetical protein Acsp02_95850 [Actinoplanes sp. NBRC 103695]|nr:hypothetical protein Acsp02_95850 [Actinoplanes sp. NBRC 103695]